MATVGPDSATLQRTRDTLGKIIKKPPLTDKLLSRPPFRYLHDIIMEVNKATGFFRGLYAGQELDGKSIQDKDSKMVFLQKAIDVLAFVQGEVVRVKPSKIVAGQEVGRTNEFLQLLSIAILKKLDSTEAVERVLSGEKPPNREKRKREGKRAVGRGEKEGVAEGEGGGGDGEQTGAKERGEKRVHSTEKPAAESKTRSHERAMVEKEKGKEGGKERRKEGGRERGKEGGKERGKEGGKERGKERKQEGPQQRPHHESSRVQPDRGSEEAGVEDEGGGRGEESGGRGGGEGGGREEEGSGEDEGLGSETRLDRPRSAKGQRRRVKTTVEKEREEDVAETSHPPPQQPSPPPPPSSTITQPKPQPTEPIGLVVGKRPGSARPAPPRIVRHPSAEDLTSRVSIETSVAPPTVILDVQGREDEEKEEEGEEGGEDKEYVVGNSAHSAPPTKQDTVALSSTDGEQPEGALTKTIVATKERLEGREGGGEGEEGVTTLTVTQRRREMEIVKKEMEKLREDIQSLCRYTNPMGRVMDYLQEDTDTMVQELERWRAENSTHRENLRREESITENELAPLKAQLEEVELHIQEQRDRIGAVKATIIRQNNSIHQLVNSLIPHS